MPLISELPVTQSVRPSHGWAYVPDTGAPIAAMAASTRKRGGPRDADNKILHNNPTVKQQKATLQRLERLAEDNWSKQTVPLPPRNRVKKSTQNVRRILASERQFKHWHDEQVAQLALGGGNTPAGGQPAVSSASTGSRRTSAVQQTPMHPPPKPFTTPRIKSEPSLILKSSPLAKTVHASSEEEEPPETVDPLLITRGIPKMPSKRLMEALLAEPPLTWDAAAARPLENNNNSKPARHFCAVCGYWGRLGVSGVGSGRVG